MSELHVVGRAIYYVATFGAIRRTGGSQKEKVGRPVLPDRKARAGATPSVGVEFSLGILQKQKY